MNPKSAVAVVLLITSLAAAQSPAAKARSVAKLLLKGDYAAVTAQFSAEMKAALPERKLAATMTSALTQLGPVRRMLAPEIVQQTSAIVAVAVPVEFEKAALNIVVAFNQAGEVGGLWLRPRAAQSAAWQPPAYSKPDSFRSQEIAVGQGARALPGTLTVPVGPGPFPAVVLVHGSGPQDREETVGGAKVFRDLADGLASRGIAVLRYEKRTKAHPAEFGPGHSFTMNEETVDDAIQAAVLLRARPPIDPKRVFVLGHSQGGYMAPRIARRDPKLAGLILLASNVRSLEDLILEQSEYLASLKGMLTAEEQAHLAQVKRDVAAIKQLAPGRANPPAVMGIPAGYFLDLKDYDPAAALARLTIPVLVLQGERDYQVTMQDFALWRKALGESKRATFRSYPQLNHLFVAGQGKSTPEEYQKPSHVAGEVITDIAAWIESGGRPLTARQR
jgi:dienelactone hydrolase